MFKGKNSIVDPSLEPKHALNFNYKSSDELEYERKRLKMSNRVNTMIKAKLKEFSFEVS